MKKLTVTALTIALATVSIATTSQARSCYTPRFSRPYVHAPYHHHHDRFWSNLGVGLLGGAIVGSLIYQSSQPPVHYYSPAPRPVIVRPAPVVVLAQPQAETPEIVLRRVTIQHELVNLRETPGLDGAVAGQVRHGDVLDVIGAAPDWLYIKTGDGHYGWIMDKYTATTALPVG